ncbi:hypothetical protein UlMin_042837 [Ulmus minor]
MSTIGGAGGELKLEEIHGRGRALVAAQPLKGGQIILRDSPILLYSALPLSPSSSSSNFYCDFCFRILNQSSSSLTRCASCSLHLFCNPNCLAAAQSSSHSPWLCQSLLRLRHPSSPLSCQPLDRHLQVRFILAAHNLALISPTQFQILISLQGTPQDSTASIAQFLYSLVTSLCPSPPPPAEGWFPVEIFAALLAKDKLNAFGLMEPFSEDGQRSVRAYGIYPKASLFNHDCLPNACRFDYLDTCSDHNNTDIIVRMIHDVPQGREICLSYFPVNENYRNRQKRLLEDYGFACHCDRCNVEANWSDQEDGQEEEEEGEAMEDDTDQNMEEQEEEEEALEPEEDTVGQAESDFPHAYFFARYMCERTNCGGTLAPLPPSTPTASSNVLECNVCGNLKRDELVEGV